MKFGTLVKNHMPMTEERSKLKQEVEFWRTFVSGTKVAISRPWIEISDRNVVRQ